MFSCKIERYAVQALVAVGGFAAVAVTLLGGASAFGGAARGWRSARFEGWDKTAQAYFDVNLRMSCNLLNSIAMVQASRWTAAPSRICAPALCLVSLIVTG
jgi:hypothetical protein